MELAWMGRGREIVKMQVLKIVTEAYIGSRLEAKLRMTLLRVEDERRIISAQVGLIKEIMGLPRKTSPRGILIELGWGCSQDRDRKTTDIQRDTDRKRRGIPKIPIRKTEGTDRQRRANRMHRGI